MNKADEKNYTVAHLPHKALFKNGLNCCKQSNCYTYRASSLSCYTE